MPVCPCVGTFARMCACVWVCVSVCAICVRVCECVCHTCVCVLVCMWVNALYYSTALSP